MVVCAHRPPVSAVTAAAGRCAHSGGGPRGAVRGRRASVGQAGAVPGEAEVREALRAVIDPEIGLNIVDLGLVYDVQIAAETGAVAVEMTLTTPGCPLHAVIDSAVREVLGDLAGVRSVALDLVWSPPWTPEMISPEGRRALGWSGAEG